MRVYNSYDVVMGKMLARTSDKRFWGGGFTDTYRIVCFVGSMKSISLTKEEIYYIKLHFGINPKNRTKIVYKERGYPGGYLKIYTTIQ